MKVDARVSFDPKRGLYDLRFKALGTDCRVQFSAGSNDQAAAFSKEAVQWVANFETKYSRFRDNSLISEINRNAGVAWTEIDTCLLYTSPSPRDRQKSRMPSSA